MRAVRDRGWASGPRPAFLQQLAGAGGHGLAVLAVQHHQQVQFGGRGHGRGQVAFLEPDAVEVGHVHLHRAQAVVLGRLLQLGGGVAPPGGDAGVQGVVAGAGARPRPGGPRWPRPGIRSRPGVMKSMTVVVPPARAARLPDTKSSQVTMPPEGRAKCTWGSTPPGTSSRPRAVDHAGAVARRQLGRVGRGQVAGQHLGDASAGGAQGARGRRPRRSPGSRRRSASCPCRRSDQRFASTPVSRLNSSIISSQRAGWAKMRAQRPPSSHRAFEIVELRAAAARPR